ncbi:MAG: ribose-phosphate pyrophosphokinase [Clostridiales bacterium]|jgi:ribose-phosphate pyrophosphokinase|nr:ribose-phosphate pyrophosphokinase [Clostridiales bacterium]
MDSVCNGRAKVMSGNSHRALAQEIANLMGTTLLDAEIGKFSDGEISLKITETVRGCDIFVVQPTSTPVNDNLMELLIMIDALKRASAGRIVAVLPYYGYARQDRKSRARDPISAKLVADIITTAGADRIVTMDLHCPQIQGFFNIPVDHLVGLPKFIEYYKKKFPGMEDVAVVSPDLGSTGKARSLADILHTTVAIVDKKRDKPNESKVMDIIGDVLGKNVIMIDDMIDTAGSIANAACAVMEAGAKSVHVCCTHGVFSGQAYTRLQASPIEEVVCLDTIDHTNCQHIDKIKYISVADIFANALSRIHDGRPVSEIFEEHDIRYN